MCNCGCQVPSLWAGEPPCCPESRRQRKPISVKEIPEIKMRDDFLEVVLCSTRSPLLYLQMWGRLLIDESLHTQWEAIRAAAAFQAWPNGSRVNAATRDCQQLLSPHLLNKWRDPSKKAQRTLTDDHNGGERYVYMDVCDHTSSGVCAHTRGANRTRTNYNLK